MKGSHERYRNGSRNGATQATEDEQHFQWRRDYLLYEVGIVVHEKKTGKEVGRVEHREGKYEVSGDLSRYVPQYAINMLRDYGLIVHRESLYQFVGLFQRFENSNCTVIDIRKTDNSSYTIRFHGYAEFIKKNPEFKDSVTRVRE